MLLLRRLAIVLLCLAATSAAANGGLEVSGAWSRATPPTLETGAVYLEIRNPGRRDDTLEGVRTDRAPQAELHRSSTEGGQARMEHTPRARIPAEGEVRFAPGGRHVMLMGLEEPLTEGERFPLTLVFERAGEIEVEVTVRPANAMGPGDED